MNQLKNKIDEVKAKLGLTQMQLSERIGKNPYYLDTVKHRGVTTERQNELIRELDLVANGGTVMTEREIIASLSERLTSAQSANRELCLKLELAEKNHRQLEGMYDSNWGRLQIQAESLKECKKQYHDLVAIMIVIGIIIILSLVAWSVI